MTPLAGRTVGIVGALEAFPFRLARREVERQGGVLRRGADRRANEVVFGRTSLRRMESGQIERAFDEVRARGLTPISESGFLRRLGLVPLSGQGTHSRSAMIETSGLATRSFDLLALFDAFGCDAEPFGFRDLILARTYRELADSGASWSDIAAAVHQVPQVGDLAALRLGFEARAIVARHGAWRGELDGQGLLDLETDEPDADAVFDAAEAAEAEGDVEAAAILYARCLAMEPSDSVAAFNRANCLRELGRPAEAAHEFARAVKRDPGFAEAWFNLALLVAERGHAESARRHLQRALAVDGSYADAAFALAKLDFETGRLAEAERGWRRYLELDADSDWAQRARNGLRLVAMQAAGAG